MTEEQHSKVKILLASCKAGQNTSLRNQAFMMLQPDIVKWMLKYRLKDGIYYSPQELLSLSWDCFLYGFHYYRPDTSAIAHFYTFTRFFTSGYKVDFKKRQEVIRKDNGKYVPIIDNSDLLYDLKKFRATLTGDYTIIFDEALESLTGGNGINRYHQIAMSKHRYQEAKKVMKFLICFLCGIDYSESLDNVPNLAVHEWGGAGPDCIFGQFAAANRKGTGQVGQA